MSDRDRNEWTRRYRQENPPVVARQKALQKARGRAGIKLSRRHPAEFWQLMLAECEALGIDPPGTNPTGRKPKQP